MLALLVWHSCRVKGPWRSLLRSYTYACTSVGYTCECEWGNANPPRSSELMITGRSDNVLCATRLCTYYVGQVGKVHVQPWHPKRKERSRLFEFILTTSIRRPSSYSSYSSYSQQDIEDAPFQNAVPETRHTLLQKLHTRASAPP